jgi:aspartate-semialdehyde dehydrogenase
MSEHGLRIAVAGATGALGQEVLAVLDQGPLAIAELSPLASMAATTTELRWRGKEHTVGLVDADSLEGADVVFACLPRGAEDELLKDAAEAGCLVVDMAGVFLTDRSVPVLGLGLNPVEHESVRESGAFIAPGGLALALAALAAPLRDHGLVGLRGTALQAASRAGRGGIQELSGQVAALFNSQDPPRKVFPQGLAFDLVPGWGEQLGDWSRDELISAAMAGRIAGVNPAGIGVSTVLTPVFMGLGLSLHALAERPLTSEQLRKAYEASPHLELGRGRDLQVRSRGGKPVISVGRLREDRAGLGVHLYACVDPLRLAAANAVASLAQLVQDGLV